MRKFISTSLFTLLTVAPAIAAASPAGGESAAPTGVAGGLAAGTALFHFWMARKTVVPQFEVLLAIAIILLGFRVWWTMRARVRTATAAISHSGSH